MSEQVHVGDSSIIHLANGESHKLKVIQVRDGYALVLDQCHQTTFWFPIERELKTQREIYKFLRRDFKRK